MTKIYEGGIGMSHHDKHGENDAEMDASQKNEENGRKSEANRGQGQAAATQRKQSPDEEAPIVDENLKTQELDEPSTDPDKEWSPGSSQFGT